MIIAWTLFIIALIVVVGAVIGVIESAVNSNYEGTADCVGLALLFAFFASLPAQYIFGG
jgi:hypothetical protein